MLKLKLGIVFLLCLVFFILSSSRNAMRKMSKFYFYTENLMLQSDKFAHGDLYGLSFLKAYKFERKDISLPIDSSNLKLKKDFQLTVLGDSYFYLNIPFQSEAFARIDSFQFINWDDFSRLDSSVHQKKRIIIIESVERGFFDRFNSKNFPQKIAFESNLSKEISTDGNDFIDQINRKMKSIFCFENMEQNLAFNLFTAAFWSPIKELKASLNLNLFSRIDDDVAFSKNRRNLFAKNTVQSRYRSSSYYPYSDAEIDHIVFNINQIKAYCINLGFDQVVFTIIPNPVVIIDSDEKRLNHVVQKLIAHPKLQATIWDVTPVLKQSDFYRSDSHWAPKGANKYLNFINQRLKEIN